MTRFLHHGSSKGPLLKTLHFFLSQFHKNNFDQHHNNNNTMTFDKPSKQKTFLPADYKPCATDVLCGRGKEYYHHPGNKRFRSLVELSLPGYTNAPNKLHKTMIVKGIIETIRESGSGFVREMEDGSWVEIGDHCAREKVGQTFRQLRPSSALRKKALKKSKSDSSVLNSQQQQQAKPLSLSARSLSLNEVLTPPCLKSMTTTDRLVASIPPMLTQYTSREWFSSVGERDFKKEVEEEDIGAFNNTFDAWITETFFEANL